MYPRLYLFILTASLPPIQKPYSLHQSPLVEGQNGVQVLGLWTFGLEEFGYNVPNYLSSLDSLGACKGEHGGLCLRVQKVRDTGIGGPVVGLWLGVQK